MQKRGGSFIRDNHVSFKRLFLLGCLGSTFMIAVCAYMRDITSLCGFIFDLLIFLGLLPVIWDIETQRKIIDANAKMIEVAFSENNPYSDMDLEGDGEEEDEDYLG